MRILAVNAGSSSLKLSVVDDNDHIEDSQEADGDADPIAALRDFAARAGDVDAVAHRLVHGGAAIRHAVLVDDEVRHQLDAAIDLAPLHVPPALALLDAARLSIDRPQVVCVDTAFHADMPAFATTYAVPVHWRTWGVRRYGFHGLSYAWSSRRSAELLERPVDGLRVVIAHIGSGVSACAVRDGRSVDTSMGFTPLEGAVMASRSGTVDPGALLWLQEHHGLTVGAMTRVLEHGSGLFGLCGMSDIRDVEREAALGNQSCVLALDVYIHVLSRVIGGLATSLDRLDALVFTGGIGEHSTLVRGRVCARLSLLGLPESLLPADRDAVIAHPDRGPAVVVVTAREDAQMAREARRVLAG
ncbi:MAG: acetate/propionate family kinase [Candidatus Dormiibacterota bacterium]